MAEYVVNKSDDAEITIDFVKGEVQMDYSLNSVSLNDYSDYYGCRPAKRPIKEKTKLFFKAIGYTLLVYPNLFVQFICMFSPKLRDIFQYKYQLFLKRFNLIINGTYLYEVHGLSDSKIILYKLNNNLWFEYELEGDYKNQIEKIQLKRNILENNHYGRKYKKQDGWMVTFSFKNAPQDGYLRLQYLNISDLGIMYTMITAIILLFIIKKIGLLT